MLRETSMLPRRSVRPLRPGIKAPAKLTGRSPDQNSGDQPVGEKPKCQRGETANQGANEQDQASVNTIRESGEPRHREHVPDGEGTRHQPGLASRQFPQRNQVLGHNGWNRHVRQEIPHLTDTHGRDKRFPLQTHSDPAHARRLSSMIATSDRMTFTDRMAQWRGSPSSERTKVIFLASRSEARTDMR